MQAGDAALEIQGVGARNLEAEVNVASGVAGERSVDENGAVVRAGVQIVIRDAVEGESAGGARVGVEVVAVEHGAAGTREIQPLRRRQSRRITGRPVVGRVRFFDSLASFRSCEPGSPKAFD